jgi:hypothetical protein
VNSFPTDIVRDDVEESNGWQDAMTAVLLVVGVVVWACFWGAIWLASLVFVALHLRDEPAARPPAALRRIWTRA